jgi:hypothetical protein
MNLVATLKLERKTYFVKPLHKGFLYSGHYIHDSIKVNISSCSVSIWMFHWKVCNKSIIPSKTTGCMDMRGQLKAVVKKCFFSLWRLGSCYCKKENNACAKSVSVWPKNLLRWKREWCLKIWLDFEIFPFLLKLIYVQNWYQTLMY